LIASEREQLSSVLVVSSEQTLIDRLDTMTQKQLARAKTGVSVELLSYRNRHVR